jgi:molecular chaperone HscA
MFITSDGRLLFGQAAVNASVADRRAGRGRIDSIKDVLAKGRPGIGLGTDRLPPDLNPTSTTLRYVDVLSMYLGYLTDMATTELAERYGTSRYVRRRVSLPAFETRYADWATTELRKLMANAQILGDTFHGKWDKGLSLHEVSGALKTLGSVAPPIALVEPAGVTEPLAAIASRTKGTLNSTGRHELFAVIDVGAGTIDFALFLRCPTQNGGPERFYLIPGTQRVLRQAGNQVDHALVQFIISQAGIQQSQTDFSLISTALSLDIRQHKEALFRGAGTEAFALINDKQVNVSREQFRNSSAVLDLERQIHRIFEEMLKGSYDSWLKERQLPIVNVLLTGGGADLPIVRSLEGTILLGSRPFQVRIGSSRPDYIEKDYPALSAEYPRLAVALGGSTGELPELLNKQFASFGGSQAPHVLDTVRKGI